MFQIYSLDLPELFDSLKSFPFEKITKGRYGGILTLPSKKEEIPVVRTTTSYKSPPYLFSKLHQDIAKEILKNMNDGKTNTNFNNAMIELYESSYKTMKFHTDMSLDLSPNSYIAIFSCYKNSKNENRSLVVKDKETFELKRISLKNNSAVVFSRETNLKYLHKIIEDTKDTNNEWIGITYRYSTTFSNRLRLAKEDEIISLYKYKKEENESINYSYPSEPLINYTLSASDLLDPIGLV